MNFSPTMMKSLFFSLLITLLVVPSMPVEAGILSGLSKLAKIANKTDSPDVDLPKPFHFKDALDKLPEGSAAEISFVNGRWVAKTPDGKQQFVDDFIDQVNDKDTPTLILAEADIPWSLSEFKSLPKGLKIQIQSYKGRTFTLHQEHIPPILKYDNVEIAIPESSRLKDVIWQLERPVMTQRVRFVTLSKDIDADLPKQAYGSKVLVDSIGLNKLVKTIEKMRYETLVLSGKIEDGFLHQGGQRISIKLLEDAAAKRDVSLVLLGSNKPQKVLGQISSNWKLINDSGANSFDTVGDFYNRLFPNHATGSSMRISLSESGELQSAFHINRKPKPKKIEEGVGEAIGGNFSTVPLHLLVRSAQIIQPNEDRAKELNNRIHPAIHSSVLLYLMLSTLLGLFTAFTTWKLYKKIWHSPIRANYKNILSFIALYLLHKICFIVLYLPVLGAFSVIYLLVKWTFSFLNFIFIRPIKWFIAKLSA